MWNNKGIWSEQFLINSLNLSTNFTYCLVQHNGRSGTFFKTHNSYHSIFKIDKNIPVSIAMGRIFKKSLSMVIWLYNGPLWMCAYWAHCVYYKHHSSQKQIIWKDKYWFWRIKTDKAISLLTRNYYDVAILIQCFDNKS